MEKFINREDAGRRLAAGLEKYSGRDDVVVLGIPRGGVAVAFEVARLLDAPLDVIVVRKLGAPEQKELALGAVAGGGVRTLNDDVIESLGITKDQIDAIATREEAVIRESEEMYRGRFAPVDVRGKTVILVDDGMATGASIHAAIWSLKHFEPTRIVVAVPTGESEVCSALQDEVDETLCLLMPDPFFAIGFAYMDFAPISDEETIDLVLRARSLRASGASDPAE